MDRSSVCRARSPTPCRQDASARPVTAGRQRAWWLARTPDPAALLPMRHHRASRLPHGSQQPGVAGSIAAGGTSSCLLRAIPRAGVRPGGFRFGRIADMLAREATRRDAMSATRHLGMRSRPRFDGISGTPWATPGEVASKEVPPGTRVSSGRLPAGRVTVSGLSVTASDDRTRKRRDLSERQTAEHPVHPH